MTDLHEMFIIAGFIAYFLIGWIFRGTYQSDKYEDRILDLMKQVETLSEKIGGDYKCPCCGERVVDGRHVGVDD